MKAIEIVTIKGWQDGCGYTYTSEYAVNEIEYEQGAQMDWSWWDVQDLPDGEDVEIICEIYAVDENGDADRSKLLEVYSVWNNELA